MAGSLVEVALDLYALPPAAFIAARAERVAALREDRELAARVGELRRPAPAAWVVNLLARERRDDLEQILALGAESRAAQAALDRAAITALGRRRRELVTALARDGGALAEAAGHRVAPAVLDAVAGTLDAGAADAEAADAIRSGRLLRALETIGFEAVDLTEAVAAPEEGSRAAVRAPARPRPRAVDDPDRELDRARRETDESVAAAQQRADDTTADLRTLDERAARLDDRRTGLDAEITDLQERLHELTAALAGVEREARALEREREKAARAADRAGSALELVRQRREALS